MIVLLKSCFKLVIISQSNLTFIYLYASEKVYLILFYNYFNLFLLSATILAVVIDIPGKNEYMM